MKLTSNPLFRSDIFFEYSRSATFTLFSICSDLDWTSFRKAMSLSTAPSNVRMKGTGLNATQDRRSMRDNKNLYCYSRPESAFDVVISLSETAPMKSLTSNLPWQYVQSLRVTEWIVAHLEGFEIELLLHWAIELIKRWGSFHCVPTRSVLANAFLVVGSVGSVRSQERVATATARSTKTGPPISVDPLDIFERILSRRDLRLESLTRTMANTDLLQTFLQLHLATDAVAVINLPSILSSLTSKSLESSPHLVKWTNRVNALIHCREPGARWAGITLALHTSKLTRNVLVSSAQSWVSTILPMLSVRASISYPLN